MPAPQPKSNSAGAIFGRYVLVESIGRGATGEVWVAIDPDLDRKVALKLLRRDRIVHAEDRAQLLAEARAMARLTHPHVVTIHDVSEVDGQLFIAMEYVAGETLDAWLARGPYPWQEALPILRQAGAGLAAAHDVALVHRDFKPANIMIGSDGRVRVLDFGLARPGAAALVETPAHPQKTQPPSPAKTAQASALEFDSDGRVIRAPGPLPPPKTTNLHLPPGTPHYMSPEQHRGEPVDARSDMFSFCVILFQALYGTRPFAGDDRHTVATNIMAGELLDIAADERAPAWIHRVIITGLATDPSRRFEDMQQLLRALERSPAQQRRRRRALAGSLAIGMALVSVALALAPDRHDTCAQQAEHTDLWNPELEARLRARVDALTPADSLASQRLGEGLEGSTAAWSKAHAQLCRDRQAKRVTLRLQQRRERCLDARRENIVALTGLASAEADPALVEALAARPYAALRSLGDPARCLELGATIHDAPALTQDQLRARASVTLTLALNPVGLERLATDTLAHNTFASQGEADPTTDPEADLLQGRLAAAAGDHQRARRHLHVVAQASTGGRHDLAVQAWLALVELELELATLGSAPQADGSQTSDNTNAGKQLRQAARLLDYAKALADPSAPALLSRVALLRGRLALALDQPELATLELSQAIERAELEPARDPDLLAALLSLRASLNPRSSPAAAADRDHAQAVLREALGPSETLR